MKNKPFGAQETLNKSSFQERRTNKEEILDKSPEEGTLGRVP